MPGMPGPQRHHSEHIDILLLSWSDIPVGGETVRQTHNSCVITIAMREVKTKHR